jgi:uncharacterized lipoprotein YmbA
MKNLTVVALATVLSACASSAPLRYYTLSEIPSAADGSANGGPAIRVGRVRIPGELDRSELVQRIDSTRVNISEQDRWAAPLEDMIRRVLSADLQARAGAGSSGAAATVSLDIQEFIGDATCSVTLRATWDLKPEDANGKSGSGHELIRTTASPGTCAVSALPMAMSQALAQLSDRIVSAAR